jgi:hypothetical protein
MVVPGVAIGATTAQPGDTLWPVKRAVEDVRLTMAMSPSRRVAVHVDLAAHRLAELNGLLSSSDADPAVVDVVIGGLRDHTDAANHMIRDVPVAEGPALADRVDGVVARQVAVLDLLLGIDCGRERNEQCVALTQTRVASAELQQTAHEIAMAGLLADTGDPTAGPVTDAAPFTSSPAVVASTPSDAVASEDPSAAASAAPGPTPSASPSPAATDDGASAQDDAVGPSPAGPSSDAAAPGSPANASDAELPAGDGATTQDGRPSDAATTEDNPLLDAVDGASNVP